MDFFARMRSCGYEIVADPEVEIRCPRGFAWDYNVKPKEAERLKQQWGSHWEQGDMAYNDNFWEGDGTFTFRKQ